MYSDMVRRFGEPQAYSALFPSTSEQAFPTYEETTNADGAITAVDGLIVSAEKIRQESGLVDDTSYDNELWDWSKAAQTHVATILGFPVVSGLRTDYYPGFAERDYHGSRLVLSRLAYANAPFAPLWSAGTYKLGDVVSDEDASANPPVPRANYRRKANGTDRAGENPIANSADWEPVGDSTGDNAVREVFYFDEDSVKRTIASNDSDNGWVFDRHASMGTFGRNRQAVVFSDKPDLETSKRLSLPVGITYSAGVSQTPEGNEAVRGAVLLIALDLAGRDPSEMPTTSAWRKAERLLEPHKESLFGLDLPDLVENERGVNIGPYYNSVYGTGRY